MLLELRVSQFALIESISIEFQKGLNILTGETGSGKSILLKSLALLMGEKASSDIIRTGAAQATVEGLFDLKNRHDLIDKLKYYDIPTDEKKLVVRRVISAEDKSKIYINGVLSTLGQLRDLVSPLIEVTGPITPLIEMTGQHDNRHLLSKAYHLDLVDQFAGVWEKRLNFEKKFKVFQNLNLEILDFTNRKNSQLQRLDYLKFQLSEFERINLDIDSDIILEESIKKLKSSHKILQFSDLCDQLAFHDEDSILQRLKTILKKSKELIQLDPMIAEKVEPLEKAQSLVDDSLFQLQSYIKKLSLDPEKLEEKEHRLSDLRKLEKKHNCQIKDFEKIFTDLKNEVSQIENFDQHLIALKKQMAAIELELKKMSEDLHMARSKSSLQLAKLVNDELLDLNMKGVLFNIQIEKLESFIHSGVSAVEFVSQTSKQDPYRPIAKVASGGELSRILLALKKSTLIQTSGLELPRTYLFDEVDTGVSGPTAEKVGLKLREIATKQQVLCVTHLPQVAACGNVHYVIEKVMDSKQTKMQVRELKQKDRIGEVARLMSGEKITQTSLAHAKQLLQV